MTKLYDRMFPDGEGERIPVHYLAAALGEYSRGNISAADIVRTWNLDAEAEANIQDLTKKIDTLTEAEASRFIVGIHDALLLAEAGISFSEKTSFETRLGIK